MNRTAVLVLVLGALVLGSGRAVLSRCAEPQVGGAASPSPQPAPTEEPQRWEWEGKVAPGQGVRVENLYGDVRARFGGYEGVVEIHAVVQNLHPQDPPLRVLPENGSRGLVIRVAREAGSAAANAAAAATSPPMGKRGDAHDRVDLVVRIPKGASLHVLTHAGAIEIKGLKCDVTAESESGAITVREVSGLVKSCNRYGDTEVVLEAPPAASEQTFESTTGDISLTLPARADATVVAQTSAWITTDVSLDIVRRPREEPSKTATGKVGTGAARLLLKTKRGSVQIFQLDDVDQMAVTPHKPKSKPSGADDD